MCFIVRPQGVRDHGLLRGRPRPEGRPKIAHTINQSNVHTNYERYKQQHKHITYKQAHTHTTHRRPKTTTQLQTQSNQSTISYKQLTQVTQQRQHTQHVYIYIYIYIYI